MTGAHFDGSGGEVDIDLLADYIGGALDGTPDEAVVAKLIAERATWRAAHRDLSDGMATVRTELARIPAEPMPADLAARLDTMLTAQTTGRTPADSLAPAPHLSLVPDADPTGDAPGVRDRQAPRQWHRTPGRAGRRLRWATPIAIAAGLVAFAGFGLDYLSGLAGPSADDGAASTGLAEPKAAADMQVLATGTDYTSATLGRVPAVQPLVGTGSATITPKSAPDGGAPRLADPLRRLHAQPALQACLDAIQQENAGGQLTVRSVDYARFDGAPALVVRFGAANGSWAWASGPTCGMPGAGANTLASVPVR